MALAAAAGTQSFTPPGYLIADYRKLAGHYGLSWQVLAALSYVQDDGYSDALAGDQASQVTSAARDALAEGGRGASVNVVAQAAAAAAAPNATLVDDAGKLAAAGGATSPGTALATVTGSDTTAQEVLTVAQRIASLSLQSDTELAGDTGGVQATAASSSSKAYADLPTSAVTSTTPPTGEARRALTAMLTEAHLLNELPYVWGGGHEDPAWLIDSGYDCSGFVSEVLHAAGYLDGPDTTQTLPDSAGILGGPGRYVTIYDRTVNTMNFGKTKKTTTTSAAMTLKQETQGVHMTGKGSKHSVSIRVSPAVQRAIEAAAIKKGNEADNTINDEHVIIDLDGQWWESGGDASDGGAEMVHQISNISQSYLKSFNLVLHPAGL
jgi:cell wall-associated NlpC family hydrolase